MNAVVRTVVHARASLRDLLAHISLGRSMLEISEPGAEHKLAIVAVHPGGGGRLGPTWNLKPDGDGDFVADLQRVLGEDWTRLGDELVIKVGRWVRKVYGAGLERNVEQNVLRVLEEALELGQAVGIGRSAVERLLDRVYASGKPPGEPRAEAADLLLCLWAYHNSADNPEPVQDLIDLLGRLDAADVAALQEKYDRKVAAGLAAPRT